MSEESVINITKSQSGPAIILNVSGKIDALTAPEFKKKIAAAVAQNPKVICNLEKVHYISSAGVGALIENKNNASKMGGDVYLSNLNIDIKKVFDLLGFSNFFKIYKNPQEAIKKFS